jgi:hypothetical protein
MSRSYHVTEKAARIAFQQGDTQPGYQVSEKACVKKAQRKTRTANGAKTNRAIVSAEIARTATVKKLLRRIDE